MGRIKEVTVSMGRTYNMGDYESFRIDGALRVEVEPGEDPLEVATKSFPALRAQMLATYKEFKPKRKESK